MYFLWRTVSLKMNWRIGLSGQYGGCCVPSKSRFTMRIRDMGCCVTYWYAVDFLRGR